MSGVAARRVLVQNCTRTITGNGREVIKRREKKEPEGDGLRLAVPGSPVSWTPCAWRGNNAIVATVSAVG